MSASRPDLQELGRLARRAAQAPGAMIARASREQAFNVEQKADGSYLTRIDKEAERIVREVIREVASKAKTVKRKER